MTNSQKNNQHGWWKKMMEEENDGKNDDGLEIWQDKNTQILIFSCKQITTSTMISTTQYVLIFLQKIVN